MGLPGFEVCEPNQVTPDEVLHVMNRVLSSPTTAADDGKEHITEGTSGIAVTLKFKKVLHTVYLSVQPGSVVF